MRYGIIVNPRAGSAEDAEKRKAIARCAEVFGKDTRVVGWDIESVDQLKEVAAEVARTVDCLVVAGGDGTMSAVLNSTDPQTMLAFIPMGSGNAWQKTLGLPASPVKAAERISRGETHMVDLVGCDHGRRALLASVGFEGQALREREQLLQDGVDGFEAYFRATTKLIFGGYKGYRARADIDGEEIEVPSTMSVIITKTPFYGYGFRVVPWAKLADGQLHVVFVSSDPPTALSGIVTSLLGGNRFGTYRICKSLHLSIDQEVQLQVDGELDRQGSEFGFRILPAALRVRF
jgi:diacylglycerol kinase family enzyme